MNPPSSSSYSPAQRAANPNSVALPNTATQAAIYELAKQLPLSQGARKQNSACDACRSRKVKCNRIEGQEKCQHCLSKNYPCTHHVQQATAEKKRIVAPRKPRGLSTSASQPYPPPYSLGGSATAPSTAPYDTSMAPALVAPHALPPAAPTALEITMHTPTAQIISFMFAPPKERSHHASPYAAWGDAATQLEDPTFRYEFALDLVEVYFQIVHTRWPLLNPSDFRTRFREGQSSGSAFDFPPPSNSSNSGFSTPTSVTRAGSSSTASRSPGAASSSVNGSVADLQPLHPAIVATVLAWGAKFSEHALFLSDRTLNGGQGRFAKALINRARDVAEAVKVHRIASPENVLIGLLMEPLQAQTEDDPEGYAGFWLSSAVRHLVSLQFNHKSVVANIENTETRGIMVFAWWMACLCDGYSSAYYRRRPLLDDGDYDVDFYTAEPIAEGDVAAQTREQLEGYYRANHALAKIARTLSKQLWRPAVEAEGIPFATLCAFMTQVYDWRDQWLMQVGVPPNSASDWDFISAISACASDATYHVLWVILFNAVDDFGIREVNEHHAAGSSPSAIPEFEQVESTKDKLLDEALHGALRIAGLAGVLASNGYLRLDTAVMHVSCIQAGTLLARLGRPEVASCIAALEQYSFAYEEAAEQGKEIERTHLSARQGEADFNHMSAAVARYAASHRDALPSEQRRD